MHCEFESQLSQQSSGSGEVNDVRSFPTQLWCGSVIYPGTSVEGKQQTAISVKKNSER